MIAHGAMASNSHRWPNAAAYSVPEILVTRQKMKDGPDPNRELEQWPVPWHSDPRFTKSSGQVGRKGNVIIGLPTRSDSG
jgi:hypothetical protein